jgi:hypothetical protein
MESALRLFPERHIIFDNRLGVTIEIGVLSTEIVERVARAFFIDVERVVHDLPPRYRETLKNIFTIHYGHATLKCLSTVRLHSLYNRFMGRMVALLGVGYDRENAFETVLQELSPADRAFTVLQANAIITNIREVFRKSVLSAVLEAGRGLPAGEVLFFNDEL